MSLVDRETAILTLFSVFIVCIKGSGSEKRFASFGSSVIREGVR